MNKTVLYEELGISRSLPSNFIQDDLPLFKKELKRFLPQVYLVEVKGARIIDGNVVEDENGAVIPSIVQTSSNKGTVINKIRSVAKKLFKHKYELKDGPYFWITDGWSQNYFHWVTDALPRLLCLVKAYGPLKVLLPHHYKQYNYVEASLKAFGCTAAFFDPVSIVIVNQLLSCTYTAPTGNFNPGLIKDVRNTLLNNSATGIQSTDSFKNIYVSRAKAAKRKVENEEEVQHLLQSFGFQTIFYEELNWDQQLRLTSEASHMVSIHGAGLTNCLFMPEGSKVLEFRHRNDSDNNCYYALCNAMNQPYYYQLCAGGKEPGNMQVNLEQLKLNVTKMMKDKQ